MDRPIEEVTPTKTKNTLKFSISKDGGITFETTGTAETDTWGLSEAIQQAQKIVEENRKSSQKIEEIKSSSELLTHFVFLGFTMVLVFGFTFSISRLLSTTVNQPIIQPTIGAKNNAK